MTEDKTSGGGVDLSRLVASASDQMVAAESKTPPPPDSGKRPATKLWLAGAGAVAGLVAFYLLAWPHLFGFSEGALRKGLIMAAEAARADVEAYRKANGALPPAMPNAALSLVVVYERSGDGYRLRADDGPVSIVMNERGEVTESSTR